MLILCQAHATAIQGYRCIQGRVTSRVMSTMTSIVPTHVAESLSAHWLNLGETQPFIGHSWHGRKIELCTYVCTYVSREANSMRGIHACTLKITLSLNNLHRNARWMPKGTAQAWAVKNWRIVGYKTHNHNNIMITIISINCNTIQVSCLSVNKACVQCWKVGVANLATGWDSELCRII